MAQAMADQCTTNPTIPNSDVYSLYTFSVLFDDRIDASAQEENIDNSVIVDTWFGCNGGPQTCDDYKKVKSKENVRINKNAEDYIYIRFMFHKLSQVFNLLHSW